LPPGAFVAFLQNHDQIGNRAFGERITRLADTRAVRAAMAILLLAPSPPMLFMGEEFGAETPFLFFCDFEKELAAAVTAGRRNEFAHFAAFANANDRERIPDPNAVTTFERSRLDWNSIDLSDPCEWLAFCRQLLKLRSQYIVPGLSTGCRVEGDYEIQKHHGLTVRWEFSDHSKLTLLANLGETAMELAVPTSPIIYATEGVVREDLKHGTLAPWSVAWFLQS
jgi:1,4-alpha-glucan branching enzyme